MEFSRPEYWSGKPFPSLGDLPNPEIKPRSPKLQVDSLPAESQGKPQTYMTICKIDSKQEFAVWLRKLKQVLCINLEGWVGEGDGREVHKGGDICIPMADSC